MAKSFSKSDAIRFGWETTKRDFWFFAKVLCAVFLFFVVLGAIVEKFSESAPLLSFLVKIAGAAVGLILSMGFIKISLKYAGGARGEWEDLYTHTRFFWNFLLASILYGFIVLCGLILFIVPGILWAIRFRFFGYFIVDKDFGALDALRKSSHITQGVRGDLFLFFGILVFINVLGMMPFGLGLFFTIPTSLIATAWVYRKLLRDTGVGLRDENR